MESIITSAKRIVIFRKGDERSAGGFSQNSAGALGVEIIITSAKRIVKFREGDESSGGLLAESYRRPRR